MYTAHDSTAIKIQKNTDEQIFVCVWDGGQGVLAAHGYFWNCATERVTIQLKIAFIAN